MISWRVACKRPGGRRAARGYAIRGSSFVDGENGQRRYARLLMPGMDPATVAELGGRGGQSEGPISGSVSRDIRLLLTREFAQRMRIIDQ